MKRILVSAAAIAMAIALAGAASAQRHDEKPHGSGKPTTEASQAPSGGGRHDEKPHGVQKKPAAKKDTTKTESKDVK